jgi:DNA-binding transcriptional LysR family regulator
LLEEELGGELVRRERNHSHLTELGRRMMPLLQQCFDAAVSAKSLAQAVQSSEIAPVQIAISNCVNISVLVQCFAELVRANPGVQLKIRRGPPSMVIAALKDGDVEVAIAGPLETWDRLDSWPLFREPVDLVVNSRHSFGRRNSPQVALSELAGESILRRVECETRVELANYLPSPQVEHEVDTDYDLLALLESNAGVAFLSATAPQSPVTRRLKLADIELWRTIAVYSVAGRLRSAAAAILLNLLRASDWSLLGVSEPS